MYSFYCVYRFQNIYNIKTLENLFVRVKFIEQLYLLLTLSLNLLCGPLLFYPGRNFKQSLQFSGSSLYDRKSSDQCESQQI